MAKKIKGCWIGATLLNVDALHCAMKTSYMVCKMSLCHSGTGMLGKVWGKGMARLPHPPINSGLH